MTFWSYVLYFIMSIKSLSCKGVSGVPRSLLISFHSMRFVAILDQFNLWTGSRTPRNLPNKYLIKRDQYSSCTTAISTNWSNFQATRSQWDWPSGRICSFHSPRRVNNVALAGHGVRGRGAADPTLGRPGAAAGPGRGRVREVEDGAGSGGRAAGGSFRFHLGEERGGCNETRRHKT